MNDRASSLVDRVIAHLKRRPDAHGVQGASDMALDKLEAVLTRHLVPTGAHLDDEPRDTP